MHLTRADEGTYQGPHVHQIVSTSTLPLTTWHKRLGHLNLVVLRKYLNELGILFVDDGKDHVCDSCQRAKATKIYNLEPQERSQHPYQFIYTDLVGPITPTGFSGERYFFTFTDDCTRHTETYTGTKKRDWLQCLKAFHNNGKNPVRLWLRITKQKGRPMACTRRNHSRAISTLLAGTKRGLRACGSYSNGYGKGLDH